MFHVKQFADRPICPPHASVEHTPPSFCALRSDAHPYARTRFLEVLGMFHVKHFSPERSKGAGNAGPAGARARVPGAFA